MAFIVDGKWPRMPDPLLVGGRVKYTRVVDSEMQRRLPVCVYARSVLVVVAHDRATLHCRVGVYLRNAGVLTKVDWFGPTQRQGP